MARSRVPGVVRGRSRLRRGQKSTTVSLKAPGPFTRRGTSPSIRGPLGNFTGKRSVPDTIVDVPRAHLTYTALTPRSTIRDTVINVTGITETFTAYPPRIIQGRAPIDVPVAHLTYTALVPDGVDQTNANDRLVNVPLAHLTYTPLVPKIEYERVIDVPVEHLTYTALDLQVDITLPGELTLTQTDLISIRNKLLDWEVENGTGLTLRSLFRAQYAELAGLTVGDPNTAGNFGYRAAGGDENAPIRLQGKVDGRGRRYLIIKSGN